MAWLSTMGLLGAGAAGGCILGRSGQRTVGDGGAGGGIGGAGGTGGAGECETPQDCAGPVTDCREQACLERTCTQIDAPVLTPCQDDGGSVCNGAGQCVRALGELCDTDEQCLSSHCADGNCCTTACTGGCERCDGTDPPGSCLPYRDGDPELVCDAGGFCDGSGGCARGNPLWHHQFAGWGTVEAWGVGADSGGNVVVVGWFDDTIDVQTDTFVAQAGGDGFVAKLDPNGTVLWARQLGDDVQSGRQRALDVAVAANDDIVVVGDFESSLRLGEGGGLLASAGLTDGFVATFNKDGVFQWGHALGGNDGNDVVRRVAVGPEGEVVVLGHFRSSAMTIGWSTVENAGPDATDLFVASCDKNGQGAWARAYGDAEEQCNLDLPCGGVDVGPDGSILLSGSVSGRVDLGGGPLGNSSGTFSAFIGQLAPNGDHLWSQSFANAQQDQGVQAIAFDTLERAWLTGNYRGDIVLGAGCPLLTADGSGFDLMLAAWNLLGGHACDASFAFRETSDQSGVAVDVDSLGNPAIVGRYRDQPNVGDGTWPWAGVDSGFLLKRSATGLPLWSHGFASDSAQDVRDVALRPDRSVAIVGDFESTIDVGGAMTAQAARDGFVAVFEP